MEKQLSTKYKFGPSFFGTFMFYSNCPLACCPLLPEQTSGFQRKNSHLGRAFLIQQRPLFGLGFVLISLLNLGGLTLWLSFATLIYAITMQSCSPTWQCFKSTSYQQQYFVYFHRSSISINIVYLYIYNICSWQNNCQSRSSTCIWKLHHRFYRDNDQTFHKTFPKSVSIWRVKRSIETLFQFWSIWSPNQEEASLHLLNLLHFTSFHILSKGQLKNSAVPQRTPKIGPQT